MPAPAPGRDMEQMERIINRTNSIDGVKVLDNISFTVNHDDKIAFVGGNELAKTTMFKTQSVPEVQQKGLPHNSSK